MGKFDQSIIHSFANQDYSYEKWHILTPSKTNQEAIPQILYYWAIKKCGFCAFMFLPNFFAHPVRDCETEMGKVFTQTNAISKQKEIAIPDWRQMKDLFKSFQMV